MKLKKPYVRKLGQISKFTIWIFDGNWARTNLDIELDNFAHHRLFPKVVPEYEIWIDRGVDPREIKLFIARSLFEWHLFSKKKSSNTVYAASNVFEKRLRKGYGLMSNKITPEKAKLELFHTTQDGIEIWIVDGAYVRQPPGGNMNFAGAAHWLVPHDHYIPEGEVWIDKQITDAERRFVAIHELCENIIMRSTKMTYDQAHKFFATPLELEARKNPDKLSAILKAVHW